MTTELVEAWRMSNESNLFLIDSIPAAALKDAYASRTRNVAAQLAHIHSVRLRWLGHAAPHLIENVESLPKDPQPTKAKLKKALKASAKSVERFLTECEASGAVARWNGSPTTFLGYLIAHEAHHRGLAMVAMRLSGRKLSQDVVYGLWQWGKKRSLRG